MSDLRSTAALDTTDFFSGLTRMRQGIEALRKQSGTLKLTVALSQGVAGDIQRQLRLVNTSIPVSLNVASLPSEIGQLKAQLQSLSGTLSSVVTINTTGLTTIQGQINTQITRLTALIQQLQSLGGSGGAGGGRGGSGPSAATRQLLDELTALNNQYRRGDVSAAQYATALTGLQSRLRVAASAATAGTADFRALDQGLTRLTQGLRQINTDALSRIRTDMAAARAAFDAASGSARTLQQRLNARTTFETEIARDRAALEALRASGQLTTAQLRQVETALGTLARTQNTIQGRINPAGLSGNIVNALQQLGQFVPGLGQATSLMGGLAGGATAATAAVGGLVLGLGGLAVVFAKSFGVAAQFEQTMADIKALTQPTTEEFGQLSEAAMKLGAPLGVGPRQAAAAMLELNKAGLSAADAINGGLVGALNLAGAAGTTAAEGAKLSVAAMTAFGLAAKDLPMVADIFANFANQTFLDAQDLQQALAAVGPVAKTAGLSLQTFGGLMATLAQGGFKNMSDAGTSLKTMLLSLEAPSDTASAALTRVGVSAYEGGKLRPLADILEQLRTKLAGLSEEGRNNALKDIFGTDGIRAATILLGQSQQAIQKNIDAIGEQGSAARVAGERLNTFQGSLKVLGAQIEQFGIKIGSAALPALTDFVKGVTGAFGFLNDLLNGGPRLAEFAATAKRVFSDAAVAVGGLALAYVYLNRVQLQALTSTVLTNAWRLLSAFPGQAATAITTKFIPAIVGAARASVAFLAANPWLLVIAGATAAAVAINDYMRATEDIKQKSFDDSMAVSKQLQDRAQELLKAGGELNRAKGQLLMAIDRQGDARLSGDKAAEQQATEQIALLRKRVTDLTAAQAVREVQERATGKSTSQLTELTKEQAKAVSEVTKSLADRRFSLKIEGESELHASLDRIKKDFDDLRIKLKEPFGANLKDPRLLAQLKELDDQLAAEQAAARKKYAQEAASAAKDSAVEAQRAEIAAMQEGAAKKAAQRDFDLQQLRESIRKQAAQYKDFPQQQAVIEANGRRQIAAMRAGWRREDDQARQEEQKKIDQERRDALQKTIDFARKAQDAQAGVGTARLNRQSTELDTSHSKAVEETRGNLGAIAQIEAQYARDRIALNEKIDQSEYAGRLTALKRTLNDGLRDEKLTAGQRSDLYRAYYDGLEALDEEFRGKASDRAAKQLQLEQQVLDAQRKAAAEPVSLAAERVKDIERLKGLTSNTGELLDLEARRRTALQDESDAIGRQLADSERLKLSVDEVRKLENDRKDIQAQIAQSVLDEARARASEPVNIAGQQVRDLERLKGLAPSQEQQYELEARRRTALQDQADAIGRQLADADRLKLSADELRKLEGERADLQAEITKSLQEEARSRAELPLTLAKSRTEELSALKQGAETLAQQIVYERERRDALAEVAGRQQGILDDARRLGLTDEQIRGYTRDRAQTLREIEASLREERALKLQILDAERQLALGAAERAVTSARSFADEQVARLGLIDQLRQEYALRQGLAENAAQEGADTDTLNKLRGDAAGALDKVRAASEGYAQAQETVRQNTLSAREALRSLRDVLDADTITGLARAERTLAEATTSTSGAYRDAAPYLDRLRRGQGLAVDELPKAQAAFEKLTGALTAQRQALGELKSKYEEARGTVSGIGGLISDLAAQTAKARGGRSALDQAITLNDNLVTRAEGVLKKLFSDPKASAEDLKKATDELTGSFQQFGGVITNVIGGGNKSQINAALKDALGNVNQARQQLDELSRDPNVDPAKLQAALQVLSGAYKTYADGVTAAVNANADLLRSRADLAEKNGDREGAEALRRQADALVKGIDRTLAPVREQINKSLTLAGPAGQLALAGLDGLKSEVDTAAAKLGATIDQIGARVPDVIVDITRQFQDAGLRSGRAFVDRFSDYVRRELSKLNVPLSVSVPTIKPPGGPGGSGVTPASTVTNFTQTITINGNDVTGTANPNIKRLLNQLRNEAQAECRRQKAR